MRRSRLKQANNEIADTAGCSASRSAELRSAARCISDLMLGRVDRNAPEM